MEFFRIEMILLWAERLLPVFVGAAGGFLYYRFVGCKSGACLITNNPWSSTLYGALLGCMTVRW